MSEPTVRATDSKGNPADVTWSFEADVRRVFGGTKVYRTPEGEFVREFTWSDSVERDSGR